jgi:non-haem Fe2+, alpha-ketoglutarate-dependent halogenase
MSGNRLSSDQKQFFHENGFIKDLSPIYDNSGVAILNEGMNELRKLLKPGETELEIREWHEASTFLFDICMHPQILDYVEDLIGSDFFIWGSSFFNKEPNSNETVSWHQDAYYWPLDPPESCTVWLSFNGSDKENGAMRIIPKSHTGGLITHMKTDDSDSVLTLECETSTYREDTQVFLNLNAGEISIHDDKIIHGSLGNESDRPRIGFAIRYSKTNVKCDLTVNPFFRSYHCRGEDTNNHNPQGPIPTAQFARIDKEYRNIETLDGK